MAKGVLIWNSAPSSSPFRVTFVNQIKVVNDATAGDVDLTIDGDTITIPVTANQIVAFDYNKQQMRDLTLTALPAACVVEVYYE